MRTLDIFCGGGGSSYGARNGGADIVCGIDLCETAIATYRDNFPQAKTYAKRLEDISLRKLHDEIGDIDLLMASPECTNHTCAKGAAPRSETSRATAMQALRYAGEFMPSWIVLENVVHMRPWSRYTELKEELASLGYNLKEFVFDASDFGVAQKRRRLFIVGNRGGEVPDITPPDWKRKKTVKGILDRPGIWKTSPLYSQNRAKPTLERAERGFAELGSNARFLVVYYGTDGCGGWQRIDRPLRTITTVDRFALIEPSVNGPEMRMLQVPELKRAMGFGDDYMMKNGTRRDQIRILGNGVCPPVMEHIVSSLSE
ncbi:MAG TPA: DNA cytosine methyltransferase [Rhodospirillaceae bacterium]|nr:MAG: DNA (cytosine-5-)-methyltransferase [Alphaproteobacteria bacterium GWF2_58_20]HAU28970.1 DNA cytosine methyltransferase [Rhodospirillaceae bacterium]